MAYPGGKNAPGVYQSIINLMPPHEVYIEPFLGSGAILRLKRPAAVSLGVDLDPAALELAVKAFHAENGDGAGGIVGNRRGSSTATIDGFGRYRQIRRYQQLWRCTPAPIVRCGDVRSRRCSIANFDVGTWFALPQCRWHRHLGAVEVDWAGDGVLRSPLPDVNPIFKAGAVPL